MRSLASSLALSAVLLLAAGQHSFGQSALDHYNRGVELRRGAVENPNRCRKIPCPGMAAAEKVSWEKAIEEFRVVISMDRAFASAYYWLGWCLNVLSTGDAMHPTPPDGTIESMQMYLALDPQGEYSAAASSFLNRIFHAPASTPEISAKAAAILRNRGTEARDSSASCWSSKFDEITDSNLRTNLLRDRAFTTEKFRQLIQQFGGTEQVLVQYEKQKEAFEGAQARGQVTIEAFGEPHAIDQMILFAEGGVEMARCMARVTRTNPPNTVLSPPEAVAGQVTPTSSNSSCKELAAYRDGQLVKDFEAAMKRYNIFRDGKLEQEKIQTETLKLMDNDWWAGQKGAEIAIEVKYYADLFNDTVGWLLPEEHFTQVYGKVATETVRLAQAKAVTVDLVKTAEEQGAKKAAQDAWKEVAKEVAGQAGSFLGIGLDAIAHTERQEEMAKYKSEVQKRVGSIDKTITGYVATMQRSQSRLQAITNLVRDIDSACNQPSVPIGRP